MINDSDNIEILRVSNSRGNHLPYSYMYENRQIPRYGFLNESYGILNFRDKNFSRRLLDFVKGNIVPYLNNKISPDSIIIEENGSENKECGRIYAKRFEYKVDLTWLKQLDIYVSCSETIDGLTYADIIQDDNDYNKKFSYKIYYDKRLHNSYELIGHCVEYMSVLLSVPFRYNDKAKMVSIIEHEIKHGYDLLKEKFITNHINRDMVAFSNMYNCSKCYMTSFWLYNETDMKIFISRLDADRIMMCFRDMVYYLNLGEIRAYLVNYKHEIENIFTEKQNVSETEKNYRGIRLFLSLLKMLVPYGIKRRFSELYGSAFEEMYGCDEKLDILPENNRYFINFKYKGAYNEQTFNKICDFYIERINKNFFKNADKIYAEIKVNHGW